MITALALVASVPADPPPKHLRGIVSANDYPTSAVRRREEGAVTFRVLVAADGKVDSCAIVSSSGFQDLDDITCQLMKKRAVFAPINANGKPSYGTYRGRIAWLLDSPKTFPDQGDLEVTINRAPEGVMMPILVPISYDLGTDGVVSNCHPSQTDKPVPQIVIDLACQGLRNSRPEIIRNRAGVAVETEVETVVRLSVQP